MGGYKIVIAVFSFAYTVLLSANHGSGLSIWPPTVCRFVCSTSACGVTNASDCHTDEQYVQRRRWCDCCFANCCGACVKTIGIGDNCSADYDSRNGHYEVCPGGSECSRDSSRCVRTNSTTPILP
ncbi:uncharacterized protein LOC111865102 isoform X2 [Cryptotermes secundus]|uniref:uncharacterized protein LOC111865102 isoform X2 n=1 Tax=Cryptotermes secundus TaxID=105785 RepID=UPI000CD7AFDA|nr:uncharacterized protein LOC111865102 isoform X2 [Cryptotermes secundus]